MTTMRTITRFTGPECDGADCDELEHRAGCSLYRSWWRLTTREYFLSEGPTNIGQVCRARSPRASNTKPWSWWAYGKGSGDVATLEEGQAAVEAALA